MSSLSISVENVSKVYRLGEINRGQFFGDVRRWMRGKFNPAHTFGDHETEAEQEPKAADLFYALKNVSFDIKQGETVGIIGANGAGKSTLLKLISRITAPSTGSIKINGRIGSLLEVGTGFHPDLTGRDNVYMNGAILGMSRSEVSSKLDDIISFSGVERFIDTPVKRYSSGMFVRLAFSVAAFLEPEILIVDEVLSVGDQAFQNRCIQRLQDIIKDGRTVLFVSHGAGQIRKLCTRAICLKSGEVICDDEPNTSLNYYQQAVRETGHAINKEKKKETDDTKRPQPKTPSEIKYDIGSEPGDEVVKVNACRIIDYDGNLIEKALSSEEFFLEIEYTVNQDGHYMRPGGIVRDEMENVLFWTADTSEKHSQEIAKTGKYKSRLKFPGHFFAPGKISISFGIGDFKITLKDFVVLSDILGILIIDDLKDAQIRGGYEGMLPGFIRPKLEWETVKEY